jgi:hypothetical protein
LGSDTGLTPVLDQRRPRRRNTGAARAEAIQWNNLLVTVNQSAGGGTGSASGRSPRR